MNEVADKWVELTLPMLPDIEVTAARAASDLARELGMSSEEIDEMAHAVIEACINAREHSCCTDRRMYLRFAGSIVDGSPRVEVTITDHGKGFDPERARAQRLESGGVPHKRGWGLQIIEAHMDEVEILSGPEGTTVRMVKQGGNRS